MKKTLLSLCALSLILFACDKDEMIPEETYPTDGLTLKQEQKLIVHARGSLTTSNIASFVGFQTLLQSQYGDNLLLTSSYETGDAIHTGYSDTLANQLGAKTPGIFINGESALGWTPEQYEVALEREPLLAVSHRGGQNDTAYFTDIKIKFFRDTNTTIIYVNSYLLSDFNATDDTIVDLTLPAFDGIVKTVNNRTVYDADYIDMDSNVVIAKGDPFNHQNVSLSINPHRFSRGINLALEINPFIQEFYAEDVLGTEFTPIRVYIKKDEDIDPVIAARIKPEFLTVVWAADLENGGYKILNAHLGK